MGGKTSSSLATMSASRQSVDRFQAPEFLDHLFDEQRRTDVEQWLEQLTNDYRYMDNDQLQAHFSFYLNQLELLGAENDSVTHNAIDDFSQTISWLVNNNIDQVCEQSAANIAAICAHLQPNSNYQEIFNQLEGFDQKFDTDQHHQYIEEHIDQDQLDQAVDRYLQELADEQGAERPRDLLEQEIRESIIFDPQFNGHLSLDLDDYEDWAAEQRRQEVERILSQHGLPQWIYNSEEKLNDPAALVSFLTDYQQSPSGNIGREIFSFDDHPQADKFFFDPETNTFFANRRSYDLQLNGRRQIIEVQEKRSSDGQGIMVESDNQTSVRIARSAEMNYDHQPVIKARLQRRGQQPEDLKVKEKHLQQAGGLQAWAINTLEEVQKQDALDNRLSADDPQAQAERLINF